MNQIFLFFHHRLTNLDFNWEQFPSETKASLLHKFILPELTQRKFANEEIVLLLKSFNKLQFNWTGNDEMSPLISNLLHEGIQSEYSTSRDSILDIFHAYLTNANVFNTIIADRIQQSFLVELQVILPNLNTVNISKVSDW